jgi:hypothetical protein
MLAKKVKSVKRGTHLVIFDIDSTVVSLKPGIIGVYKIEGEKETWMDFETYQEDKKKSDYNVSYDYRDFDDPEKIKRAIVEGTPIIKNLEILDTYINAGWELAFLTGKSSEDEVYKIMVDWMEYKDVNGNMHPLRNRLSKTLSRATADEKYARFYGGLPTAEAKANSIKNLAIMYQSVVFIDDDERNLKEVEKLHLPNIRMIKA